MRLGQLARKLALKPVEIVEFLARNAIQIESGNNTRIEDDHVVLVLQKYAPGELIENVEKAIAEEEKIPEAPEYIVPESPSIELVAVEEPILEEEKVEVIKAPKIELSGLKVLGKIELPETRKKEPIAGTDQPTEQATKNGEVRRPVRQSNFQARVRANQSPQRPAKNPIAVEREREAREAELKRKDEIELEKEKRTLHYLKKINIAQPTKAMKIQEEKLERKQIIKAPAPTTLWGRFRRWLNS
ncbi:hypothetical protein BH09BAC3_BH09BAC3_28830 [soil metagenome]